MKLPRGLSGSDAVKALERLGFIRMFRGSLRVTMPAHDSLSPGTLQSILRQAAVELAEFIKALG